MIFTKIFNNLLNIFLKLSIMNLGFIILNISKRVNEINLKTKLKKTYFLELTFFLYSRCIDNKLNTSKNLG